MKTMRIVGGIGIGVIIGGILAVTAFSVGLWKALLIWGVAFILSTALAFCAWAVGCEK